MTVALTRTPDAMHPDSYTQPDNSMPIKFFEKRIFAGQDGDWYLLPDIDRPVSVTISFVEAGSAYLRATDSPSSLLNPSVYGFTGILNSPITYTYQGDRAKDNFGGSSSDMLTDTAHLLVLGPTAIKICIGSGSAVLTIRA
jgi:hypothetical protein